MHAPRDRRALLALFAVALGVRLLFLALHARAIGPENLLLSNPDAATYVAPAESLRRGLGFTFALPDGRPFPETMRTPGYPLLIAGFQEAFGARWHLALLLFQALLDAALVFPVASIAGAVAGRRAALVAAAFYALAVAPAFHATEVMTEAVFTALSVAGVWVAYRALLAPGPGAGRQLLRGALAGAILGAAMLVRPVGLHEFALALGAGLAASLAAAVLRGPWLEVFRRQRLLWFFAPALATVVLLAAGWTVRNGRATGYWALSSIDYTNLSFYRAAASEAIGRRVPVGVVLEEYRVRHGLPTAPVWDETPDGLARGKVLKQEAIATILAHKAGYLRQAAEGCARLLVSASSKPLVTMLGRVAGWAVSYAVIGLLVAAWLLAAVAVVRFPPLRFLAVVVLAYVAVASGYDAYARFRVPVEPFLAILSGCGLASVLDARASRRAGPGAPGPARVA